MFPTSHKINRGGHDLKMLVNSCIANEYTDLIILSETRGRPGWWIIYYGYFCQDKKILFTDDFLDDNTISK